VSRERFWWWHLGSDLPPDALQGLAVTADVIAEFPAAQSQLDRLIGAAGWVRSLPQSRPTGPQRVVSLAAWIAARRAGTPDTPALAAGFSAGETTLIDERDYQVSWRDPNELIIDLVLDRRNGEVPTVQVGEQTLVTEPVPNAEERFVTRLDPAALESPDALLLLPFVSGTVSVPLGKKT
jgi:hypothetical protein